MPSLLHPIAAFFVFLIMTCFPASGAAVVVVPQDGVKHVVPDGITRPTLTSRSLRSCACSWTPRGFPPLTTPILEQYAILLSAYGRNRENERLVDELTLLAKKIEDAYSMEGFVNADAVLRRRLNVGYCDYDPQTGIGMVFSEEKQVYQELLSCNTVDAYKASEEQVKYFVNDVETQFGTQISWLVASPTPAATSSPPSDIMPSLDGPLSNTGIDAIPLPSSSSMPSPSTPPPAPLLVPETKPFEDPSSTAVPLLIKEQPGDRDDDDDGEEWSDGDDGQFWEED